MLSNIRRDQRDEQIFYASVFRFLYCQLSVNRKHESQRRGWFAFIYYYKRSVCVYIIFNFIFVTSSMFKLFLQCKFEAFLMLTTIL